MAASNWAITSDASSYFVVNGTTVELTAAGATYVNANGSLPYDIEVTVTDTGASNPPAALEMYSPSGRLA